MTSEDGNMKKFLSLFCVLALLAAFAVIPAAAVEASQTIVDVDPGDEVSYQLVLSDVDEKVVGCDFSVYYDSDTLDVDSVADFTNSTNEDDWRAMINEDLDGEVLGNWSILRGVDFSNGGNIVTVNFKAKQSASTHISYYVRYLYPDSLQQFQKYTFTCNVTKNGSTVLQNAKPELGNNTSNDPGQFVNSVDGDSANAGQAAASGGNEGGNADEPVENNPGGGNSSDTTTAPAGSTVANSATAANTPATKAGGVETIVSTDAEGNEVITVVSATPNEVKGGTSPALWIILGVIVVAGVCVVIYFVMKKKNGPTDGDGNTPATKESAEK